MARLLQGDCAGNLMKSLGHLRTKLLCVHSQFNFYFLVFWLKQQKFIVLGFHRLEVQSQGVSMTDSFCEPRGEAVSGSLLTSSGRPQSADSHRLRVSLTVLGSIPAPGVHSRPEINTP